MPTVRCKPDHIYEQVSKILDDYGESLHMQIQKGVEKVGHETAKYLQDISPKDTGKYSKGWTAKTIRADSIRTEVSVYNKSAYQLTHLLEFGHAVMKGGRTIGDAPAHPHISVAEKWAAEQIEDVLWRALSR